MVQRPRAYAEERNRNYCRAERFRSFAITVRVAVLRHLSDGRSLKIIFRKELPLRPNKLSPCASLAFAAGILAFACPAQAQRAGSGPFASLGGSWSGTGTITLANGSNERIRCRAAYAPEGGNGLRSNLRCASDSYTFDLTSEVTYNGGPISGRWVETTRNAGGAISGAASGDQIQVRVEGGFFSANMTLVTRGDRQSVTIQSPGNELREVSITLRKR